MPSKTEQKVLFLTTSTLWYKEGDQPSLYDLVMRELTRRAPGYEWPRAVAPLFFSPRMAERAVEQAKLHAPDVIVVVTSNNQFLVNSTLKRIEKIGVVYNNARKVGHVLRQLAGGGTDGSSSVRGLLFRGPQAMARRVLGDSVPRFSMADSLSQTLETLSGILELEDVPLVCRIGQLSVLPASPEVARHYRILVDEFDAQVIAFCQQRHIPWYDMGARLSAAGIPIQWASDGTHMAQPIREFEAPIMAGFILNALQLGSPSVAEAF
jgi:hypothetical protein